MICSAPLILTETSSPRIKHWEIALQQHNAVPAVPLILSIQLLSFVISSSASVKKPSNKKKTPAKPQMQNTLVACTRCSLLSSLVVSDARWSCVANSRHGRAHSFLMFLALKFQRWLCCQDFKGSEKNLQLTCVVSMPGICFKCVCGGCFLGYF